MMTYTYFYRDSNGQMVSPFFDSEKEAMDWAKENKLIDPWDEWKPNKDI